MKTKSLYKNSISKLVFLLIYTNLLIRNISKKITNNKFNLLLIIFFSETACDRMPIRNYSTYYNFIHIAENEILLKKYESSLSNYKEAFKSVETPFAIDYYNAAICAIHTNSIDLSYKYMDKLVQKGCNINFFNQKVFDTLRKNSKGWQQFKSNYNRNKHIFEQKINLELREQVINLVKRDQQQYCKPNRALHIDSIHYVNEVVKNEFNELIQQKGFPSEHLIGLEIINDTIISTSMTHVLLLHQYQDGDFEMNKDLRQYILDGKIRNREAAAIYEFFDERAFGTQVLQEWDNILYERTCSSQEKDRIDFNREYFLMESYESYKKKVYYQYVSGNSLQFDFGFYWAKMKADNSPPKDILQYLTENNFYIEVKNCDK